MYEYTVWDIDNNREDIIHGYTYKDAIKRCNMEGANLKLLSCEYID